MLPNLNQSVVKANHKLHFIFILEIHAHYACDFSTLLLSPETLPRVIYAIRAIFKSEAENIFVDAFDFPYFRLFINVEDKLRPLEHPDTVVIGPSHQLHVARLV